MNRRFGAVLGRRMARSMARSFTPSPEQLVAQVINSHGTQAQRAWPRADSYALDGVTGKVGAWVDRLDASHLLAQASNARQVAVPSADAALANALSATFSAHWYDSNRPASSWRPYHDGTGCTVINVFVPTTFETTTSVLLSTYGISGAGFDMRRTGDDTRAIGRNDSGNIFTPQGGTMVDGAGHWSMYQFLSAREPEEVTITLDGAQVAQADASGAPSAGDPGATLRLGALANGGGPWLGRWAESMLIPGILSSEELGIIENYLSLRYGLTA